MKSFRADSIVKDAEAIRKALTEDYPEEKKKWSIIGQSFGGFCCTTYLSFYPEGLKEAFLFGGLPPLRDGPDDVYKKLYPRVAKRNEQYYAKYPEDVERVRRIVKLLRRFGDETVRVQGGEGHLSAARFLQLGINFGMHGKFLMAAEFRKGLEHHISSTLNQTVKQYKLPDQSQHQPPKRNPLTTIQEASTASTSKSSAPTTTSLSSATSHPPPSSKSNAPNPGTQT